MNSLRQKFIREPVFSDFFEFFEVENDLMNDPMYSIEAVKSIHRDKTSSEDKSLKTFATAVQPKSDCIFCTSAEHDVDQCKEFLEKSVDDRSQ